MAPDPSHQASRERSEDLSVQDSDANVDLVIGAGPAGLSAAYRLVTSGRRVIILEKDPRYVGGLSRTVEYKGYRVDLGGHRFYTKSDRVREFWHEILGSEMLSRNRLSRIFYRRKFFAYPLKPLDALSKLGVLNAFLCVGSFFKSKILPRSPVVSFEDWITNNFGERLYRIFFKTYTEKVWGMPPSKIASNWASQRIKGLSMTSLLKSLLIPQSVSRDGKQVIKTLIDQFEYPRLGPGQLWEMVAERIKEKGGAIHFDAAVESIDFPGDGKVVVTSVSSSGQKIQWKGRSLVSTMPLRQLILGLGDVPSEVRIAAESLSYRDFLIVVLIVDSEDIFPDNWIYIHDPSVKVGRIQNFGNWSPDLLGSPGTTSLGMEYFCFENDELWRRSDGELISLATTEINSLGLLKGAKVIDGTVIRVQKAYPVYDCRFKEAVSVIRRHLESHLPILQVAGRNGMHFYNNQDHSIMTGFLCADNLIDAQISRDPWKVTEDASYIEEVTRDDLNSTHRLTPTAL